MVVYVNHRPYLDITKDDLLQALSKCLDSQSEDVSGTVSDNSVVSRAKVQSLLQQYGELINIVFSNDNN